MKKSLSILVLALTVASAMAQGWYQTVGPTNSLSCSLTNFPGIPAYYSIYFGTNGTPKRYNTRTMPVPLTNFLGSARSDIYCLTLTATTTNLAETLPSTNVYIFWVAPPTVLGSPGGITVK